MKRRQFLQCTIVTAGSVTLGIGCGGGDTPPGNTDGGVNPDLEDPPAADVSVDLSRFPQGVASGDPSAESVILWTRLAPLDEAADGSVTLEVSLDPGFTERLTLGGGTSEILVAEAAFDHCVKVRMEGLEASTTYHYRFLHGAGEDLVSSTVGQTRTAPSADDDRPVRFAVVSCQDYIGRYYNSYRRLAQEDVDFVLHLGDYVYETTGDVSFQTAGEERAIIFRDPEEAIVFNEGSDSEFYAARSLGNYRDLYRTIRGDADLQAVHARAPFVIIWDDHEFSDDCHGAYGVYYEDPEQDLDVARRQAANQAWFEYMPVDYAGDPDFRYDPSVSFPDDIRIYRDLPYGKHLHLVLTDLRSHRGDHLIPERGYPGAVALTEEELLEAFGEIPELAEPYLDIETWAGGIYAQHLIAGGATEDEATGFISAGWLNQVLAALKEELGEAFATPLLVEADFETMARGLAWHQLGKLNSSGSLGSRYFVVRDTFELYAAARWALTDGASEDMMGAQQRAWLLDTLSTSDRTWKVWGTSFVFASRGIDVSSIDTLPPAFQQRFLLSAEDWDGFPNRRAALTEALSDVGDVVALSGDIHAFFASRPEVPGDPSRAIVEFTTGGVSSQSYRKLLVQTAENDPALNAAGAANLAALIDGFIRDDVNRPNPHVAHSDTTHNGFSIIEVDGGALTAHFHAIFETGALTRLEGADLEEAFSVSSYQVKQGSADLYQEQEDGAWLRWDRETMDWV